MTGQVTPISNMDSHIAVPHWTHKTSTPVWYSLIVDYYSCLRQATRDFDQIADLQDLRPPPVCSL